MDDSLVGKVAADLAISDWVLVGRARNWIVGQGWTTNGHVVASIYRPNAADAGVLTPNILDKASTDLMFAVKANAAMAAQWMSSMPVGAMRVTRSLALTDEDVVLLEQFGLDQPLSLSTALGAGEGFLPWTDARLAQLAGALAFQQAPYHRAGLSHLNICPTTVMRTVHGHCYCAAALPPENALINACKRDDVANLNIYCAPELFDATSIDISPAADVYSASALLFHLATGTPPPRWEDRLRPAVADELKAALGGRDAMLMEAIVAGLSPAAGDRPADLAEWSAMVCTCVGGSSQTDIVDPWTETDDVAKGKPGFRDKLMEFDPSAEARALDAGRSGQIRPGDGGDHRLVGRFLFGFAFVVLAVAIAWMAYHWALNRRSPARADDAVAIASMGEASTGSDRTGHPRLERVRWPNGLTTDLSPFTGQFCTQQEQQCVYSPMTIEAREVNGKLRLVIDSVQNDFTFDPDRSRPFDDHPMLYLVAVGDVALGSPATVQLTASDLGRDGPVRFGDRVEVRWASSSRTEIYVRCRAGCEPADQRPDALSSIQSRPIPRSEPVKTR